MGSSEDETVKKVSKKSVKKTQENDDWSDDQPFYGFKPCDQDLRKSVKRRNCNMFGIEDLDLYEAIDGQLALPPNTFEVLLSTQTVTAFKKLLAKDKESMKILSKIRGVRAPIKPKAKETVVKGPGDYPMPPSPESNTPSDDSNEEKGSVSPIIGSTNIDSVEKLASPQRRQARRAK